MEEKIEINIDEVVSGIFYVEIEKIENTNFIGRLLEKLHYVKI
jgi:hypothetical protein